MSWQKQRSKDRATTASSDKGKPNKGTPKGGSSIRVTKKAKIEKFCQRYKTYDGSHQTYITNECHRWAKVGKPLIQFESKPSVKHKPYKKNGGE